MTAIVPDDVWAQLDPAGPRLTRRDRLSLLAVGVVVAVAATLFAIAVQSGRVTPRLVMQVTSTTIDRSHHTLTLHYLIDNQGWYDERATAVHEHDAGLQLTGPPKSFSIRAGRSGLVNLTFTVDDCALVGYRDPLRPVLDVHRWWGTRNVTMPTPDNLQTMIASACGQ